MHRGLTAIGLMSGTSMDGIDVALIRTDGETYVERKATAFQAFTEKERALMLDAVREAAALQQRTARPPQVLAAETMITESHGRLVNGFLAEHGLTGDEVDIIGFHGQTVLHRPERQLTIQLGDGQRLADMTGIDVIYDFRAADISAGGEGAPLAPIYHGALAEFYNVMLPAVFVNIGGVANVTWIGREGALLAFDTGPGNALLDDWVFRHTGDTCDREGNLARQGQADEACLEALLANSYFAERPPKTLDRNAFSSDGLDGLSAADGAATLTEFTARTIGLSEQFMPEPPRAWIVVGGGSHNLALMTVLKARVSGEVMTANGLGLSADSIEAEAFAFLAVRSHFGLPLTFPETTGVPYPLTGGVIAHPPERSCNGGRSPHA
ncbi:MAG: anhydro-N-acetylmuramic acid kinase [Methyloligellaceae bacterium]